MQQKGETRTNINVHAGFMMEPARGLEPPTRALRTKKCAVAEISKLPNNRAFFAFPK